MKKFLNTERITAIIWFLLAVVVFISASRMPKPLLDPVGPGLFPKVVSIMIMVISTIHFLLNGDMPETVKKELHWKNVAILAGLIIAYILLFPRIGFPVATTAFLFAFSTIFDSRPMSEKWKANILFSIVFMAVLYLIFKVLLGIMLPTVIIGH